jgi:Ca2+-binding RTX toxin-like protein
MPTVLPSELIVLAYLDNPISGTQRRAQELLDRIEQSILAGTEEWLILNPSFDRASSFITEQDINQTVGNIRKAIENRGIEIVGGAAVYDAWAQAANGAWIDVEILFAAGQGCSIFAFYPETLARNIQACQQCYGISLSTLQISSESTLEPFLSHHDADFNGGDRPADSSDTSLDTSSLGQSTLSKAGVESVSIPNALLSWLFAFLIPFLLRQEQVSTPIDDEVTGASNLMPQPDLDLVPLARLHSDSIEIRDALFKQGLSSSVQIGQSNDSATHADLRASESQTENQPAESLMGGDRHPFFDEHLPTDFTPTTTAITVSDLAEDTAGQDEVDPTSLFQVFPALEKLPQLISVEHLPKLVNGSDPIVSGGNSPFSGDTPPHHPKPQSHPGKPQLPRPTPSGTPALPVPSHTPDISTSPDPSLDIGGNGSEDYPTGTSSGSDPGQTNGNSTGTDGGSDLGQPHGSSSAPKTIDTLGGRFVIEIIPEVETLIITHFGGVGTGTHPPQAIIEEADTLKFTGDAAFNAQNMILTQQGEDLVIRFEGVSGTEVVLKNFQVENLDNLLRQSGASVDLVNMLFDGQNSPQDTYDVLNADWDLNQVLNPNTVTFLNDRDNHVTGLEESDDVINGQGGNDTLIGLGRNDLLRGGSGNDVLLGGAGSNSLTGNEGNDKFVLSTDGVSQINDFTLGQDLIGLPKNITYEHLEIRQGVGSNSNDTWILFNSKTLALVKDTKANNLTANNFFLDIQ